MDQCPLCLNKQTSSKKVSDGFGKGAVAVSSIPIVHLVVCPDCGKYKITEDAIFFLKRYDETRQRAVTDIRKRGLIGQVAEEGKMLTITSDMLQGYWREGDSLSA